MGYSAFPPPESVTSEQILNALNWLPHKAKGDGMEESCILKAHESFDGRLEGWEGWEEGKKVERPQLQQEPSNLHAEAPITTINSIISLPDGISTDLA